MYKTLFYFLFSINLILMNSCSSFLNNENLKPNYIMPQKIDQNFEVTGRFFTQKNNKRFHGNFSWIKNKEMEEFNFLTPLGTTIATIQIIKNDQFLIYNNKRYGKDKIESLMINQLGFYLPLENLHYWIQGVNYPTTTQIKLVQNGFIQDNWLVEYLDFDKLHPKIINCSKKNYIIKIFIKW